MKQPKLELLSPAGSWEALEAAVRSGADAVYLGGSLFSARANAQNFDHDTLKQAVAYCHARGVKVHLAVNTILLNHEIAPARIIFKRNQRNFPGIKRRWFCTC